MSDAVNSPVHYQGHGSGLECVDLAELQTFNLGNALKYCFRAGKKADPTEQDLAKAIWYLRREAARIETEAKLFEMNEALYLVSAHEPGETPLSYVLSAMRGGGSPAALRYAAQRIEEELP